LKALVVLVLRCKKKGKTSVVPRTNKKYQTKDKMAVKFKVSKTLKDKAAGLTIQ